jgi:Uri superfamily endonuclease
MYHREDFPETALNIAVLKSKPPSSLVKGSYLLLIRLRQSEIMRIGKLYIIAFPRGYYAYSGSARNGLEARIGRHLKRDKTCHWHIDYFLEKAEVEKVFVWQTDERLECLIAQALSQDFQCVRGFGCSDCRCYSHLTFSKGRGKLESAILAIADQAGLDYQILRKEELVHGFRV